MECLCLLGEPTGAKREELGRTGFRVRSGDLGEGVQSRGSSLGCRGARGLEFLPEKEA